MSVFHKLPVKEIRRETVDSVSISFEVPDNLKNEFRFVPGQYITLQAELDGKTLRRAYSICASPRSGELRVAVKEVDKGRFSTFVNRKLKAGDRMEASAPEGRFVLEPSVHTKKNYLAFAAGSGITPVISMIRSVLEDEPQSTFVLVYGNRSKEKTMFKEDLDALATASGGRFGVHYVYSQIIGDKAWFGRIDQMLVKRVLEKEHAGRKFDTFFLCGPEEMIDTVRETLLDKGIRQDDILYELFTTTSHKKEVDTSLSGNTQITVMLDDEQTTFEMRQDEIILDAALAKGLDAPYSCQGGICSSCLARVVEGHAVMEKNTILDADEIAEGLILTCQAHPTTAAIRIDYDDV